MPVTFTLPDNFTVTDEEFLDSKREQERVYSLEGNRQANRSYLDPLGHARWDTDYITLRMAGYAHAAALQEMRVRIRAAWNPPLPALEPHATPPTPPTRPAPAAPTIPVGPGGRTPSRSGSPLPLPEYGAEVVRAVARALPGALQLSCQPNGGTWEFLDWVVDTLRTYDTRWGYNGKRGNAHDPSMDVVAYHYGDGPDEGSTAVYIIDVIGGHCGPAPAPIWHDVTDLTIQSGTIGRWISRGRF